MKRSTALGAAALATLTLLATAACTSHSSGQQPDPPNTLHVLAGSELSDLTPILADLTKATGITVKLDYTGTLDGVEQVTNGSAAKHYQAIWFSSNRYLELLPGAQQRITTQTKIISSPVILGVRQSVAHSLGWDTKQPTWKQIADAAAAKQFSYGMTNPAASNSGFSALVAIASALSGTGAALSADQVRTVTPQLKQFFGAQALTAGSSGWLADAYRKRVQSGQSIDALVNYESVLLSLDATGQLPEPLTLVYPSDGVVTADYPLTLLAGATPQVRDRYQAVADWLRRPEVQRRLMDQTHRRPALPGIATAGTFGGGTLVELPFPAQVGTADALISAYNDVFRRPSNTIYVLDLSGSMDGDRLNGLKAALLGLTGADTSLSGRFSSFHQREQVTLLPFSTQPQQAHRFVVPPQNPTPVLDSIRSTVNSWHADGATAIYDALTEAYLQAQQQIGEDPQRLTTIVLLTDGELTEGRDFNGFRDFYRGLPPQVHAVPVFPVLFGESAVDEMQQLADLTGGRTFDGRSGSLGNVFKEIRGYQ